MAEIINDFMYFGDSNSSNSSITVNDYIYFGDSYSNIKKTTLVINDFMSFSGSDNLIKNISFICNESLSFVENIIAFSKYKITINDFIKFKDNHISYKNGMVDNDVDVYSVNLKNQAVSFYDNYYFNSVAKHNNRYLVSNEDGIFELDGLLDDEFDIRTRLSSALLDLSNGLKAKLEQMVLYVKNDNTINVLVKTDDGNTYDYVLNETNDNYTSKRVKFGKGLKSSYYSFELNTDGGEYTLDNIKLYILVSSRLTR